MKPRLMATGMAMMPKPRSPVVTVSGPLVASLPGKAAHRVTIIPEVFEGLLLHQVEQGIVGDHGKFIG